MNGNRLTLLAAVVIGIGVLWFRCSQPPVLDSAAFAAQPRARAIEAAAVGAGEKAERRLVSEVGAKPKQPSRGASSGDPVATIEVREEATGQPLAGAQVFVGNEAMDKATEFRCDAEGSFRIAPAAIGCAFDDCVHVKVVETVQGEQRIAFAGPASLSDPGLILVGRRVVIRGRLLCSAREDRWRVALHLPGLHGDEPERALGRGRTDAGGRFGVAVRLPKRAKSLLLTAAPESGLRNCVYSRVLDLAHVESEYRVEFDLIRHRFTASGMDGRRIEAARVTLASEEGSPLEVLQGRTDPKGRLSLWLERSRRYELVASVAGQFNLRRRLAGNGEVEHRLEFAKVDAGSYLEGRVLGPDGEAVAGAYVSAGPVSDAPRVQIAGMVGSKSDAKGRFRLPVSEFPVEVMAFHKDFGESPILRIRSGVDLLLRLPATGRLVVRAAGGLGHSRGGPVEWVLVDQRREATKFGQGNLPLQLNYVARGVYNLFVRASGAELFGSSMVTVGEGTQEVRVVFRPTQWVSGRLLDRLGKPVAGVRMVVVAQEWGEDLVGRWGQAKTDKSGRFRLFTGARSSVQVQVSTGGTRMLTAGLEKDWILQR